MEGEGKGKKRPKKRRITESAVTPAHSVFRSSNLDTVADWGWRIFLWEEVVQGGGNRGHVEVNVKGKKRPKKRRITESAVTPTYDAFRRDELDTVAGWGWRIFL